MPRLLLVEKDPFLQHTFRELLTAEGYFCAVASHGAETRRALERSAFDLLILDLGQSPEEGLALMRQIRLGHRIPVLMLARDAAIADRVAGLEGGADDYLCEPYDPRELVARVRAQLRRAGEYSNPVGRELSLDLAGLCLHPDRRDAFRNGVPLHLTAREFDLLHLLARHPNEALASEWILENIWGGAAQHGLASLKVCVGRLRRKIELDPAHPLLLISVRGFGYQLVAESESARS